MNTPLPLPVASPAVTAAQRRTAWLTLFALTGLFVLSFTWRPADEPKLNLCLFRALTGHPCPGCGMTRAFCALSHGEVWRAVRFNPLSPAAYLFVLWSWVKSLATLSGWPAALRLAARVRLSKPFPQVALGVILAWWLFRLAVGWN